MNLQEYFREPWLSAALERYARVVTSDLNWPVTGKHRLYTLAKQAFEGDAGSPAGVRAFSEVFDTLKRYWGMLRNAYEGRSWNALETYEALLACEDDVGRGTDVSLLSLQEDHSHRQAVLRSLERLRGVKAVRSSQNYPWMPAAKLFHFFNPRVFAIYDDAVVWQMVLWRGQTKSGCRRDGAFRADYERFCADRDLRCRECSERFNLNYWLLGSEVLGRSDSQAVMSRFAAWFEEQVGGGQPGDPVLREIRTYYGAAFEVVAIGAASLVLSPNSG